MNYIPPIDNKIVNRYTDGSPARAAHNFPVNLAATLPIDTQRQILLWLSQKYIWPQIQERQPFELVWDKLLEMSRVVQSKDEIFGTYNQEDSRAAKEAADSSKKSVRVSDTVVHDAIERLANITHFVSFKEGLPVQFQIPKYVSDPAATTEYHPLEDRIKAANALLHWNSDNQDVYRNHLIATRQHYTYGLGYILSDFEFKVELIARQNNMGQIIPNPEITKLGTTFQPISIRKVWLNWRLPAYNMDWQPCPFLFEETPRFAILQNVYDPMTNPFGYVNQDKIMQDEWLYTGTEMSSVRKALDSTFSGADREPSAKLATILEPKHSVEARWLMFPMMPLDPATGEFDHDGSKKIPYKRFVMETFGPNVHSGGQVLLRLQENYYPANKLPLYASCHMPDLDSGAYPPSIGSLLYNHYKEINLCIEQYNTNKDWINDPPSWVQISSPASEQDLTAKGAKIKVNGPNDFGWRQPYDATSSTVAMVQMLREQAQTTSKAVDAALGKAMGSRTSATEASNAYQAAMSGITTDINLINYDMMGGYAERLWHYTGLWFDPDLLEAITGQLGFKLTPEDMWMNVALDWDIGSTYIESIVRQQNVRYVLEAGRMDPSLRRDEFWKLLLSEMGFDASKLINDNDYGHQVQLATLQAIKVYLGYPIVISPTQNHEIAIKVKTSFLEDTNSVWNKEHGDNAGKLVEQIQQHQQLLMLEMEMMNAQMEAQQLLQPSLSETQANQRQQQQVDPGKAQTTPGQARQATGQ
jgi:hypothetical protein